MVTGASSPVEKSAVTWEQFSEMLRTEYVPLVERDRLAQEYLLLRHATNLVTNITKMFTDKA